MGTEHGDGDAVSPDARLDVRSMLVGVDAPVPTLGGTSVPYVNLDNAASTPSFTTVVEALDRFLPYYSSVHRGTGYKSRLSTAVYERAREIVGAFVGADPVRDVVVFTKNTTEAINKLARSLPMPPDSVVLTTTLEHHSNDLPWRSRTRTAHVRARPDGTLDIDHLDHLLERHAGRVALLAVSGASNVTGVIQPIHVLAEKVHAAGGRILVDAAQLAPHRPIDMGAHDDRGHVDFLALSAHKMYAPYGSGALIGCRDSFRDPPQQPGGGTVEAVGLDDVVWAGLPDREEAGSPNVLGAVALATAMQTLTRLGMDRLVAHETALAEYTTARLAEVPGLRIYGPRDVTATSKVAVFAFTLAGVEHGLVAAALGHEHGVGVRSGCFCAHPYVTHLLGLDTSAVDQWVARTRHGDNWGPRGMVRISLGCYNTAADVDHAVAALHRVAAGAMAGTYQAEPDGSYRAVGSPEPQLFSLDEPSLTSAAW